MKILVVRFSSIGDIVLTSPVIRCIRQQIPDVELHYLTKQSFASVVAGNPHLDKVITIRKSIREVVPQLKEEKYDFLVDLHNNIRTLSLKNQLGVKSSAFPKLHIAKWMLVHMKRNRMPDIHVVDRYFRAVKPLGVINDRLPCDFFISPGEEIDPGARFGVQPGTYIAFAVGAQFATKRMPVSKMIAVLEKIDRPVILLGGETDIETGKTLVENLPSGKVINTCGTLSLQGSASIVRQAAAVLTHDTGLMHIASAFEVPVVSVWGNTVPEFGMYPYFPQHPELFSIHGVTGLSCRPCSKIGFRKCPKGHFNCMNLQDAGSIAGDINSR